MEDKTTPMSLPITQLRPLHTARIEPGGAMSTTELTWISSVDFQLNKRDIRQAFVELVSRIAIIDTDEEFCIQDTEQGGYIKARKKASRNSYDGTTTFCAVPFEGDVPTDFSIGSGKVIQLHTSENGQVHLVTQANVIPQMGLDALGQALQDILIDLNQNGASTHSHNTIQWTKPSVLNWPPRERPVSLWPGDAIDDTGPALLHSWFDKRAQDCPERVALDFLVDLDGQTVQYTYKQVFNAATALATKLYEASLEVTTSVAGLRTVAVAMGPSPELYVSYLATLKAGLAFCPIPADAPEERIDALLVDLQPVAVLVMESSSERIQKTERPIINASSFLQTCNMEPPSLPGTIYMKETDAAYILYTSGTTGMPKGVIVSHLSAACTISALSQCYGFCNGNATKSDRPVRWFQGAAPTFDISLFEIFWTLSTGATLCCAPRNLTMQNIDGVISALQADITNVTPSFASLINPDLLTGLMVGGETLNARLLHDYARHNPSENAASKGNIPQGIYNGYGPTEVTIYSIAQPHVPTNQRGSVIGKPLATCSVLIVEEQTSDASHLEPVPFGTTGELVLAGPQVSRSGYLNRREETAKSFVDDSRWGRIYRTGDRARIVWNEEGEPVVEFLGRISDAQVKLSGRRVELGEIENVLASNVSSVQQTLACAWKPHNDGTLGSEKVVSLIVVDSKRGQNFTAVQEECFEAARRHLPDYMRPFRILQVESLPRSASGKVNRKAAAASVHEALQEAGKENRQQETVKSLQNEKDARIEEALVDILAEVVGSKNLNATTKLAEVGVDSLRAMRLLRDIRTLWPKSRDLQPSLGMLLDSEASIRSVFFPAYDLAPKHEKKIITQKTLANFASRHATQSLEKLGSSYLRLDDVEMVLPATSTQSQLAVSFAMDRRNYISHTVLPLKPDVSLDTLEKAVRSVFQRQTVYRSALVPCSDDLAPFSQVILKSEAWNRWTEKDPRIVRKHVASDNARCQTQTDELLEMAQEHLNFDTNQLYYVQIAESTSPVLVISIAHCLCDGASVDVLVSDIAREYIGLDPLDRLSLKDAVEDWVSGLDSDADQHWKDLLQGWEAESFHALSGGNVKSASLPAALSEHSHAMVDFAGGLTWKALEEKSRAIGASPLSVLQAAWSLLLRIFSEANTEDIVFGSVLSGQHEATHALTFSVVPCRVPLPEQQTVGSLLNLLVERSRFAQSHRNTSFGLFDALPYNTVLALQTYSPDIMTTSTETEDVPWKTVHTPAIRYDFDIFSEVLPAADAAEAITFKLTYRDDVLSETSAKVIVRQFAALAKTLLTSGTDDLVQRLPAGLPRSLLSIEGTPHVPTQNQAEQERERRERTDILHAQFETQATMTPDRLALSFYSTLDAAPVNLTYRELDERANGLANILREEDLEVIPICMYRSVELYISILAILKAGSAWSPIDETSPVQRRTSLIARTQGKVLLTTTSSYAALVEPCLAHESLAGVRVIFVDQYAHLKTSVRATPRKGVVSSPKTVISGQDLAYLLWTSGTTGEPKGVMIQHFAAANAMRDLQVRVEHDTNAGQVRTLQLSAYSFDVFVQDLFYTWGLAGSVISGTRELVLGTFAEFVHVAKPTHAHLTPSFGASINVEELAGSTLRFVTFIGEKLTEDVAEAWAAPRITTKAYNTYGPAENAVVSTMRQFFGKSHDPAKAANVGFPLTPCTAYVVREVAAQGGESKQWELVPRYGVGELALGGAQVAKGYLNNEAKTTKSFIQGGPGIDERIYLTGDMVRLNDHGFEFLGRNDDLVKITGIRIELSEISAACALIKDDDPTVEHVETLYLPRPGVSGNDANHKVIVSFVSVKSSSPSSPAAIDTQNIRQRVFQKAKEVLPAYMVPGHVVVLETTMPRTASNKVDRKALQAIYNNADLNVLAGRKDRTDVHGLQDRVKWTEVQLPMVRAIAKHLAVPMEDLDPEDSLASLGFSSLQVTKLAWELRRKMGCAVGVLDLMRCQTMGELVEVVKVSLQKKETATLPEDKNHEREGEVKSWVASLQDSLTKNLYGSARPSNTTYILPATPVQESLLVETMIDHEAYWSHRLFDLSSLGKVDPSRLKSAWTAATAQLDILRTVFVPLSQLSVQGQGSSTSSNTQEWARSQGVHATILQLVLDQVDIQWSELANTDNLASHAHETQKDLTPLTTTTDSRPPWAVAFSSSENIMMLSMHHALYDGESSQMILDVVANLYGDTSVSGLILSFAKGLQLGLLPSRTQRNEANAAWTKHIHLLVEGDGALNAPFPDLTGSRQKQEHTILSAKVRVPDQLLAHLQHKQTAGTPDLPRLVLSAFGCVLAAALELKTIILGQTVSQRILHPDLTHVVGPAMATLPVAIRTHASSAQALWTEMNRDASLLGPLSHHLHPVDIKKMINKGSHDANAPFPALFVYHPASEETHSNVSDSASTFHEIGQALPLQVEHSMALNVFEANRTIELTGDARRISQSMLDIMLAQIIDQARAMLEHPEDVPLSRLSNYLDRNLTSVVGECSTLVGRRIATNPAELVTKQAAEHPEWAAIEEIFLDDDDEGGDLITTRTLSYGDLEVLVNAIASQLVHFQLAPDDVVALYLERDTKSLAAILAIFKCRFVYLPIDGELPTARKQLLVHDANAKLVITTKSLVEDLHLEEVQDKVETLLLPEGDDELDIIRSWPNTLADIPGTGAGGYLLYTSGSTGRPKGVRVTNENLLHFVAAMTQRLTEANPAMATLGGVGKFLNVASRAFDTHLTTMFAPWHLGFRSAIGKDRNGIFASLKQVINEVEITNMGTVPSVLLQLGLQLSDVPSLRVLTFGGEKASHELFQQLGADDPSGMAAPLMNFYGPTEATVGCLSHVIGHHSNARNLGLPLPGLQALLLVSDADSGGDESKQVVARRGQPGEFCIAGPQVAVGYLNRPEENARSFQHTTLLGERKRIYRTGDIMRMMHDGTVEFLGRRDQQTKIRGQRFEIGEVEAFVKKVVAEQGPLDVAAAVVDQQRLVGLLARKPNTLLKAEREAGPELLLPPLPSKACQVVLNMVEQACQKGLPSFMVPEMMWVSKIPYLAASGKLDTKRIAQLVKDVDQSAFYDASAVETNLASVTQAVSLSLEAKEVVAALEEVLGNKVEANPTTNLRALGIDSLSGVHLLSVLKRKGFKVALAELLSPSCSLSSVAQSFDGALSPTSETPNLPKTSSLDLKDIGPSANHLDPTNVTAVLPCLPLQSSLVALSLNWLQGEIDENQSRGVVPYVTEFNYELATDTDIDQWKLAVEQAISSEATLRTCFIQRDQDGQIFQVVLASPPSVFSNAEDDATSLGTQISSQPPIRVRLFEDKRVSLLIHHALYDGSAIATLRKKIEQTYFAMINGSELNTNQSLSASLDNLRTLSLHCSLDSEEMHSVKVAWKAKLEGISPCRVDGNPERDNSNKSATTRWAHTLSYTTSEMRSQLQLTGDKTRPGSTSISASTAFQLATVVCLAHLTGGNPSIVFGFTMSLRPLLSHVAEGVDSFVGPCLNTIVHALTLHDANETLPNLAARIDRIHAEVCQGNMPLVTADKIQRWTGLEEKLFDSLLTINVIDEDGPDAERSNIMRPLPGKAKLDQALTIDVDLHKNGEIALTLASAGVLTQEELKTVGLLFEKIVENAANTSTTVAQFVTVKSTSEKAKTLVGMKSDPASESKVENDGFQTALEIVCSTACRLLGLDENAIGSENPASTSLYRLGLDSINVLPFVKLINKAEGIKVTPNAVIRAQTLQGVASLVARAKAKAASKHKTIRSIPKIDNINHSESPRYEQTLQQLSEDLLFVATPLQEGMLSASMALADQAYTYTHTMKLSDDALQLDAPNFSRFFASVQDTVQACEILRTRFMFTDHSHAPWVGIISPTIQSELLQWQVSSSGIIQLRIHHALYDARSIQLLWRLLNENYATRLWGHQKEGAKMPQDVYLYRPFAKRSAVAQTAAVAFWGHAVQDYVYQPVALSGSETLHASSSFYFSLSDSELARLRAKCREANVSPKSALQLSWAKVLCESLYKQSDVVFGEVITADGNDEDGTDNGDKIVMGPTINTVPLRIKFMRPSPPRSVGPSAGPVSIAEALSRLQTLGDQARGPHGMASLRAVQTAWRSSRAYGADTSAGLFQSLFVFDGDVSANMDGNAANNPILPVSPEVSKDNLGDRQTEKSEKSPVYDDYPLIVSFRVRDGVLYGALRAKVDEDEVHRLGTQLETALRYVLSKQLDTPALDPAVPVRAERTNEHDSGYDSEHLCSKWQWKWKLR